jgi:hypothetical protein
MLSFLNEGNKFTMCYLKYSRVNLSGFTICHDYIIKQATV